MDTFDDQKKLALALAQRDEARDEVKRLRSELEKVKGAVFGDPPEELYHLQPIEWLHTMIDECKQRTDEVNDPDSWLQMIHEVENLYGGLKAALAGGQS